MNYKDYNDYELLFYIQESNEDANEILYKKYETLIQKEAKDFYQKNHYIGIDLSDFIQEGMLGLNRAIHEYNEKKDVLFYTYATTCIKNALRSYVIKLKRQKHQFLNEAISIDQSFLSEQTTNNFLLKDSSKNPEDLLIYQEQERKIYQYALKKLTKFEFQVFQLRFNHVSSKQIAQILKKDHKSIDNTIQRIHTKFKKDGILSFEC